MEDIARGQSGAAVEDVQQRLIFLGFDVGEEAVTTEFGPRTAQAVSEFRKAHGLPDGEIVDALCWPVLVDASFSLGDRSLYLRQPNLHGNDVKEIQNILNTLGFPCGEPDAIYGVHTEAAVKEFQANMALPADGIAFQDTFDALELLHHAWKGKNPHSHSAAITGLARTASVLERLHIALVGLEPISHNIASRMWNIASATTVASNVTLHNSKDDLPEKTQVIFEIAVDHDEEEGAPLVLLRADGSLPLRVATAVRVAESNPPLVRIELYDEIDQLGSFTAHQAQAIAIQLIDAICDAFDDLEEDNIDPA